MLISSQTRNLECFFCYEEMGEIYKCEGCFQCPRRCNNIYVEMDLVKTDIITHFAFNFSTKYYVRSSPMLNLCSIEIFDAEEILDREVKIEYTNPSNLDSLEKIEKILKYRNF
jgi:hypothetical protein